MADARQRRPLRDWMIAAEACLRLLAAEAALKALPFSWVARTLSRKPIPGGRDEDQVARIVWAVTAAAVRLPLALTCLRRAFAASWMLQARGIAAELHYGVAKNPCGGFRAHAWVESGGHPVIGHREAEGFTLLAVFPPRAKAPLAGSKPPLGAGSETSAG